MRFKKPLNYNVAGRLYHVFFNTVIFSWQSMLGKRGIFANFATIFNL